MAISIPVKYSINQRQFKSPNWCKIINDEGTEEVIVGSVNNLYLKLLIPASQNNPINITYQYKNMKESFTATTSNPSITLDLSDKLDLKPIKMKIIIGSSEYSYPKEMDITLNSKYYQVGNATFYDVLTADNKIFEISEDITTTDITISHDVIIKGNNNIIDLDNHTLTISEGISVKIYDVKFKNGAPLFIQKENSVLELYNCEFEDCTATDYEGLGSVIHCDVDLENLTIENDYRTIIENSSFKDCAGAILSDGELIINKCDFEISDASKIVDTAPQFLYQTSGEGDIRNSSFDISLDDNYFCQNEINVKLGQCLILCGENAVINSRDSEDLMNDDKLIFSDSPYNNQTHIFMKYYYTPINDCVYISPIQNRENKSLCYAVQGVDWIYKQNVQITRASWNTENRNGMGGE